MAQVPATRSPKPVSARRYAAVGRGIGLDVLALVLIAVMTVLAFFVSSAAQRRSLVTASALTFGPPAIMFAVSMLVTPVLTGRYLGLGMPEPTDLLDADPAVAACIASTDPDEYEFIDGVRLYSVPCPASE